MRCASCQHENRSEARFCEECGASLARRCATCGSETRPGARFCDSCGARVESAPAREPEPAPEDGERRQLTVMFCDLVDSSTLAEHLDPEDLAQVLREYHQLCGQIVLGYGGHVARIVGDGLLVYFGYPQAHEDDAQRSVRAALGIMHRLTSLDARLRAERGVHLRGRIGIHTGLVVVGEMRSGDERDPAAITGETPNLAARLQSVAPPGDVLISAATHQLVAGYFAVEPVGELRLRGVSAPIAPFRVVAESGARSRLEIARPGGLTPLVGRTHELALLVERWAQAREGIGQVVILVGEAGIGKSRLVHMLKEHIALDSHAWMTPVQCSPYHQNSALYPWADLLERVALGLSGHETAPERLTRLEGWLATYALPLGETVPLFAEMLSIPLGASYTPLDLSPPQRRRKVMEAVLAIFGELTARQPVLIAIEDLHWADASTLELLELIIDQAPTTRLMVLATCRPGLALPWLGRSHVSPVTLGRLPRSQTAVLAERVARDKALPLGVLDQIVARTDGVPLFVEELTKDMLESGLLHETESGYELTGQVLPLAIPATLQDSLLARLDRLADVKGVAQLAASIGREFAYDLLVASARALGLDDAVVSEGLGKLMAAELIYQRGLPPRATYLFKHALVRDAAYDSLLRSRRQLYHRQIALALESSFPHVVEQEPEVVAHHYAEAGRAVQALPYWRRAGERALGRWAYVEAEAHLRRAIATVALLPESASSAEEEFSLQIALGSAALALHGYAAPAVEAAYSRAEQLGRELGKDEELLPVLYGLWAYYFVGAKHDVALEYGQQISDRTERIRHPAVVVSYRALGLPLMCLGRFAAADEQFATLARSYDRESHHHLARQFGQDPGATGLIGGAWTLWHLGFPDQALARSNEAVRLARELGHPLSVAYVLGLGALLSMSLRQADDVIAQVEEGLPLCIERGFALWDAWLRFSRGWATAVNGNAAEGRTEVLRALAASRATGAGSFRSAQLALLAEVLGIAGYQGEQRAAIDEGFAFASQTSESYWLAELHRLRGELALSSNAIEEAGADFRAALATARRQGAKCFELRAAMSLARLYQKLGQSDKARAELSTVYGWFTEGFETPDLIDARDLLSELSAVPASR